jgi:hypothetical protein
MPIEFELELADNDAPIVHNLSTNLIAASSSLSWNIQNSQIKCDILSLHNALDNSYANHLLGGNTLEIVYNTYMFIYIYIYIYIYISSSSSIQTITSADTQVNVSRSLTALRSVFMSLHKAFTEARLKWCNKSWTTFYSTMIGTRDGPSNNKYSDNDIQRLQLMVGSKMYPEHPIRSHAECFYNSRKSLSVQANSLHAIDIKGNAYRDNTFVVGFDMKDM